MRELKPITDAGEPGTIILAAADSGAGDGERFALPVTDELRDLVAAVSVPVGESLDDASAHPDSPGDPEAAAQEEAAPDDAAQVDAPQDTDSDENSAAADDTADEAASRPEPVVVEMAEPKMVLRPREIQDRVRGGASVEELLELTGMPARRIEPFAHPVLAERARIAELGKQSRPRRADGPAKLTLWEILATAFAARGLDLTTSEWDAWRDPAGQWIIGVTWSAGHSTTTAEWAFHAEGASASTVARNTIAAELVDPDFARPRRNLSSVEGEAPGLRPAPEAAPHVTPGAPGAHDAGAAGVSEDGHGDHGHPGHHGPHSPHDHGGDADSDGINDDADFLRHPDEGPAPKRRRKTVMPSWEDVLLGVRPTDRK
ncbi:septation protein SepH [Corynebacterium sp. NPDC060344]|uniref:septation protein SepH n=1 Tax=Corynebacterium sp. NPDC060344 TaxID=3347101 RepID=UPI0036551A15